MQIILFLKIVLSSFIVSILQLRKLELREVKWLAQDQITKKQQSLFITVSLPIPITTPTRI